MEELLQFKKQAVEREKKLLKQIKELDDLAQLESKQLGQQDHVIKKKEAAALAELKAKAEAEAAEAENEEVRAELVNFPVTSASQCLF